jgi:hypothetical protein
MTARCLTGLDSFRTLEESDGVHIGPPKVRLDIEV